MKRWNGWGSEETIYPLPESAKDYLKGYIGEGCTAQDATLESMISQVPASRLNKHENVSIDAEERLRHACGQSLPDWISLRSGRIPAFPDGVFYPIQENQIQEIFTIAEDNHFILIPYGGGTSVLRHINPPESSSPVLTIDLSKLEKMLDLDEASLLATFEAGIRGPILESNLNKHGYTLGHFPQSFEYSTLGGWVATRSSGQQSFYYGRIEDLFRGGHLITPTGEISFPPFPASAAGPDLRHLVLGSEGRFGILTRGIVAIKPLPDFEEFYGYIFKEWQGGLTAVRKLISDHVQLSMIRLSDSQETQTTLLLSGQDNLVSWASYGLEKIGYDQKRCLLLVGVTGNRKTAVKAKETATRICRKSGGLSTGKFIGRSWQKSRFLVPYLRNSLWEAGYALDTLETAVPWNKVDQLKNELISAIETASEKLDEKVLVFGHLSHVYATGASIYITFIFRRTQDPDEMLQHWQVMKNAASEVILTWGGTISHQHGVGRDHADFLSREKGDLGVDLLTEIGKSLDPKNLLNPGVLFRGDKLQQLI